jgi:PAS domain S-box-containing protein
MRDSLEQSRSHRLLTQFIQISFSRRVALVGFTFVIYAALILLMRQQWGGGIGAWGILVAMMSGWLLGVWGGLIGGLLLLPLDFILFSFLGENGRQFIQEVGGVWGPATAVIAGVTVGWLQTMATRLEQELSQRRLIEAALRASEERHRQMFTNNQAVKLLIDPTSGAIVDANPAAVKFYGYSLAQLQKMSISDINNLSPTEVKIEMNRAARSEQSYFLFKHRLASGELRDVEVYSGPVEVGAQTLLFSIVHDITERALAEAALSESEEKYRSLIEQSNDAIYLLVNDRFEMINARFSEMLGIKPKEAAAPDFDLLDLVAPESRPLIDERGRKTAAGEPLSNRYEFVALTRDGRRLHLEASVSYPEYRGQKAVQGILRDITERYEAQEALRQSEEKFRALIENALDVITVVEADGRILYESPSVEHILGYKPEEMVGRNVLSFIHPEDRRASIQVFAQWLQPPPEQVEPVSFRFRNKRGEWRILEGTGRDLRDNPAIQGIVVNCRDVTERRLAQAGLRRRTAELEAMVQVSAELRQANNITDIVPIILQQTRLLNTDILSAIFLLDPVVGDLVAYARREENGPPTVWRQPSDRGIAGHVMQTDEIYITGDLSDDPLSALYGQKTAVMRSNIFLPLRAQRRVSGALHVALPEKRPFTEEDIRLLTAIAEITSSAIDRAYVLETLEQRVSERTQALAQANERLQQLDQLKSKFVSDVSHELRTPIANLNLYLDLLDRGHAERRESYMAVLREQTERLTQLIEDILDLTRLELNQKNVPWEPVNLNKLVGQVFTAHVLRAEASGLRLRMELAPELPPLLGNPNQILQVITNLVTNALNYTPAGEVLVETGYDRQAARLWLKVTDNGLGIEPDDIPYLFDRFYRGKWVSQSAIPGTGLGLAIVKEIVDLHDGRIDVVSQPGEGSTFRVCWPMVGEDCQDERD